MKSHLLISVCAVATALAGCQKNDEGGDESSSEAEAEAAEGESAEAGACDEFSKKVCAEAGDSSQTCSSVKTTAGLMSEEACEVAVRDIDTALTALADKRESCSELADKLCADIGEDTQSCSMVKERLPSIPPAQCEEMLAKYDQVLAGLKAEEMKNKPLDDEMASKIAASDAPAFGPEEAKVTVVEFSDFQCPYCSRAAKVANHLKDEYGDQVRFVFRQFPLRRIHEDADLAAQAALAAAEQGKFWEYHDVLFENQSALGRESLEKYAQQVGLNMAEFEKALDDGTYEDQVQSDFELGQEVGVSGTPTMFVNGERVANPTSPQAVAKVIDGKLSE